MQPPPPTGCTGMAPLPFQGAGTALDDGLIALLGASSIPVILNAAARATAAPLSIAATVVPLRFVTTLSCSFSSEDAPSEQDGPGRR